MLPVDPARPKRPGNRQPFATAGTGDSHTLKAVSVELAQARAEIAKLKRRLMRGINITATIPDLGPIELSLEMAEVLRDELITKIDAALSSDVD